MNVIGNSKNSPFVVQLFTGEEELHSYLNHNQPEVLLISEEGYTYEIGRKHEGRLLVLMDEEEEGRCRQYGENAIGIYKYQSAEKILREVIHNSAGNIKDYRDCVDILGVFSPAKIDAIASFALSTAKVLSEQKHVLYINLEEFSGLNDILPAVHDMTLSDALYYYRQNNGNVNQKVTSTICSSGGIDYIPPVQCAEDIAFVDTGQILNFVNDIGRSEGYDVVVMDISYAIKQQWKLISGCKKVYMPIRNDYISVKKQQSFEAYFLAAGMENILEHICKVKLPVEECDITAEFWDRIAYGGMYKFVRKLMDEQQCGGK
jgi:hypothetical protein